MEYKKLRCYLYKKYLVSISNSYFGLRYVFLFENGYGANVVKNIFSYGNTRNLFQLAVLKDGQICYETEITDDVIGYLTNRQVIRILKRIKELK